jgi:Flp pilus assembly protein TadG
VRNFANTKKRNRESGYGLVFAALGLIVLLGAAGMSVDVGYLRYQRRLLQSAADSAALAGAAELGAGSGGAAAVTAAKNDSQLNGFQDGSGNITVTATPTSINGNANTMQVQVTNIYPTFFMRIFGGALRNVTVSTTATAQYLGGRGCIYALTGGGGLNVTGNVNVPNCNVISNQNITGGGSITAASIGAHGRSSVAATPAAITGILQASDPLSYLPAPGTGGGCTNIDWNSAVRGNQTLTPGVYCQIVFEPNTGGRRGVPPAGAFAGNVTFTPGTYVITGGNGHTGGLTFEGTGTVSGNGVTFYIANGAVTFANTQRIQLRASTNAPYAGVLLFQSAGNGSAATINGSGGSYVQGALYFPNATLTMSGAGNSGTSRYLLLVAKTLNINTNVTTTSNYSSLPNQYSPVRTATLIQ